MGKHTDKKIFGLSGRALLIWGLLCLSAGAAGQMMQRVWLHADTRNSAELLETLSRSETAMGIATLSIVLQAIRTCAVVLFAFLLVEGFFHTASRTKYALLTAALALLCEIPYHLVVEGHVFSWNSHNMIFGFLICLAELEFLERYAGKNAVGIFWGMAITAASIFWTAAARIADGGACALLTAVFWSVRGRENLRTLVGAVAAGACCLFSPFYLAAPIGALALHFYQGEKGAEKQTEKR